MTASAQPSRPEILSAIRAFVASWFRDGNDAGLDEDTPLVTSGIVDSAGVLELVEFLEQRYAIEVADEDVTVHNCNSLLALTELVLRKLGVAPQAR